MIAPRCSLRSPRLPRTLAVLLPVALVAGCLSLPAPPPATQPSAVGDPAPVGTLARTGEEPGTLDLADLWRGHRGAVLVFYRGEW